MRWKEGVTAAYLHWFYGLGISRLGFFLFSRFDAIPAIGIVAGPPEVTTAYNLNFRLVFVNVHFYGGNYYGYLGVNGIIVFHEFIAEAYCCLNINIHLFSALASNFCLGFSLET